MWIWLYLLPSAGGLDQIHLRGCRCTPACWPFWVRGPSKRVGRWVGAALCSVPSSNEARSLAGTFAQHRPIAQHQLIVSDASHACILSDHPLCRFCIAARSRVNMTHMRINVGSWIMCFAAWHGRAGRVQRRRPRHAPSSSIQSRTKRGPCPKMWSRKSRPSG